MVEVSSNGNFDKTRRFLNRLLKGDIYKDLDNYGQMGVRALANATPVETGLTQHSWAYRIRITKNIRKIEWYNTDVVMGDVPVVILIQYGHGTGTGGYVQGRDFINPAMRPIFEHAINDVWEKVKSL